MAKIILKIARFALSEDPAGVILTTNHYAFVKLPYVKKLVLKIGFLHHKVASRPHKRPEFAKKSLKSPHK